MNPFDPINTPEGQAAIDRLAKDLGGCRNSATINLQVAMLVPKARLEQLIARKTWADPRMYDAACEAVKLK